MKFLLFFVVIGFWVACNNSKTETSSIELIVISQKRIDSIRNNSDTGYTRTIGATEFNMAEQYLDKKNNILSKIMRDTGGHIIAVLQFRNNVRITYEEYYSNGQLKGQLPLNSEGQFDGPSKYYHENGRIKSKGNYVKGFFSGFWKNYDANGKMISTDEYDNNGQLVKTIAN